MNLTELERREVRLMAFDKTFAEIGAKFKVHRATVSRYIKQELDAGRMGKQGRNFVCAKGAYDLETGAPVNPPVDTKP